MKPWELTVQIDRAPEEVFAFLSDLENDPMWRREFVDAKHHSEDVIGVGTTTSMFGQALGRRVETIYQVSDYEPNSSATWTSVKNPFLCPSGAESKGERGARSRRLATLRTSEVSRH